MSEQPNCPHCKAGKDPRQPSWNGFECGTPEELKWRDANCYEREIAQLKAERDGLLHLALVNEQLRRDVVKIADERDALAKDKQWQPISDLGKTRINEDGHLEWETYTGHETRRLFAVFLSSGVIEFYAAAIDDNGSLILEDGDDVGWNWWDVSYYMEIPTVKGDK